MQARRGFLLTLISILALILAPSSAHAQAMGEYAGINAGVAGMGAGVAASMHNGILVRRTYKSAVQAQQALIAQNQAVEQYLKLGTQFQSKKEWDNAEKAFTYVLQVIARRDGPGSPNGVPALRHLVAICKAQNKIDQAISFQKTVLAFTQADKKAETKVLIKEQERLSNLFIAKSDYASAEPLLRNTVALYRQATPSSTTPTNRYTRTLRVYGTVLRQLNKADEAAQIESQLVDIQTAAEFGPDANTSPLADGNTKSNSAETPSIANIEDSPHDQSTGVNRVSTLPENATANSAPAKLAGTAGSPEDPVSINPAPIPPQKSEKLDETGNVTTASKDSEISPKAPAPDDKQASPLPDSPNNPVTPQLPSPSSSSSSFSSLPEPALNSIPDSTQQAH